MGLGGGGTWTRAKPSLVCGRKDRTKAGGDPKQALGGKETTVASLSDTDDGNNINQSFQTQVTLKAPIPNITDHLVSAPKFSGLDQRPGHVTQRTRNRAAPKPTRGWRGEPQQTACDICQVTTAREHLQELESAAGCQQTRQLVFQTGSSEETPANSSEPRLHSSQNTDDGRRRRL